MKKSWWASCDRMIIKGQGGLKKFHLTARFHMCVSPATFTYSRHHPYNCILYLIITTEVLHLSWRRWMQVRHLMSKMLTPKAFNTIANHFSNILLKIDVRNVEIRMLLTCQIEGKRQVYGAIKHLASIFWLVLPKNLCKSKWYCTISVKVKVFQWHLHFHIVSERACAHCAKSGDGDACRYWGGGQDDDDDDGTLFKKKVILMMVLCSRRGVQGDILVKWKETTSRSLAPPWGGHCFLLLLLLLLLLFFML